MVLQLGGSRRPPETGKESTASPKDVVPERWFPALHRLRPGLEAARSLSRIEKRSAYISKRQRNNDKFSKVKAPEKGRGEGAPLVWNNRIKSLVVHFFTLTGREETTGRTLF